ncbi:MAG: DUF72 domain-containing protein [Nitrospira sp. BO4]|jgi:uncharacterized protein YecE (DUF72 family)|nr:DUF72 domain-containing protein [Nitrospira sp. BO4]
MEKIQYYKRPALGYQVILFARGSNYLGIHPTLHTVIEYQYGSRYSYPARDEADAREQAVSYAISAITNHYARLGTWTEARIYPFGGLIGDMRVIAVRPRIEYTVNNSTGRGTMMDDSGLVRFGTSTWTYEGWQGQVYLKQYAKTTFARECLGEYCQYLYNGKPLFRTVGNDATFYRPPTANQLRHILKQIPEDFEMCFKVWEQLTIPVYANQPRYGQEAGKPNPHFLNAKLFNDLVLIPYREARFESHMGPFLFEFQRHGMTTDEFCSRLDTFFSQLPTEFKYAVEIRNPSLLGPAYRQVLERHGVAHVYNHWCYMPPLAEQHKRMEEDFTAPFTVLRLLTPLKMSYEAAKKRAEPYNKIVGELPEMRKDAVALIQESVKLAKPAYVLVNNRSEGNAPTTIQALVEML